MCFVKVRKLFPAFSDELIAALRDMDEAELAIQVPDLEFIRRCGCGDAFCASFYTADVPQGPWPGPHRNLVLAPRTGMLILDVVDDRIAFVEVLERPDFKAAVDRVAPVSGDSEG